MQNVITSASGGEDKIEVKQISERKIRINESKMYLGEDNILYVTVIGDSDENTAIAHLEVYQKLANIVSGKVNVVIDLNNAGKQT
jgi:hypothetical protein